MTTTAPLPPGLPSVLAFCPSWVGDTVMATPVLSALRARLPGTRIIAAVRPGLGPLLRAAPSVDEIVTLDPRGFVGPLRAAAVIRRLDPAAILLLPNSGRSALTARLAGTPIRVGYDRDGRRRLLTHALPLTRAPEPTPALEYYARLGAYALGADDIARRLELGLAREDEIAADHALDGVTPPFVLMTPGANRRDKRWPAERFARVADALHAAHGLPTIVSGGPGESEVLRKIIENAQTPVHDVSARGVDLGGLKAVVARAALLITNDTGPRHLAAALGTPAVSLFGPTDHRWTLLPDAPERRLLAEPFLPADLVADTHRRLCVIDRIPVGDVIDAAEQLLGARASTVPA